MVSSDTRLVSSGEHREKAVLVGVDTPGTGRGIDESLDELERLADTAGLEVVGRVVQRLDSPVAATYIGSGKVEEVAAMVRDLEAGVVIFDDDLTPSQQQNIESRIKETKIGDRTALILDIFALHATSREGKLQVELAQMEYLLPRLRGMWRHLDVIAGGGVLTRGPGEAQLETDRRLARKRITELRRELKKVASTREVQRKARSAGGSYRIALVGYTNAGKSSLLNRLTGAEVLVYDMLFATLDSTTRRFTLPEGRAVTLTDTVGFIQKLPHGLVEAFKSTLDEVVEADLLLHVADASSEGLDDQMAAVKEVLDEIGAAAIPTLVVFNKVDVADPVELEALKRRRPDALFVSAVTGEGVEELLQRIDSEAASGDRALTVLIPYDSGELVQVAHERASITSQRHTHDGTLISLRVPAYLVSRFEPFSVIPETVTEKVE